MVGLLFPGQGSQHVGMGADLARHHAVARQVFEEADTVLGFGLSRLAWDGPEAELTQTHNAQPAILTHSIAVFRLLADSLGDVCCAAGHSLGEFSAYVAAGSMSFADALRTVRRRGELMLESGDARPGAMAAVLGLDAAAVEAVCAAVSGDGGVCVPANYNAPGQVVISGDASTVEQAMLRMREAGARRAIALNVSGAFHSPLMEPAAEGLSAQLDAVELTDPRFAVISNVTAEAVHDAAQARPLLLRQLTSPVRWTACIEAMLREGGTEFLELGPGNVLSGLLRRIAQGVEGRAVGTVEQVAAFAEAA